MSQPTAYSKTTNFAQDEANNVGGRSTVRTSNLDAELRNIETTFDETLSNLSLIQRDDGKLRDRLVELYNISTAALQILQESITYRGAWAAHTAYASSDMVSVNDSYYLCGVAHTSDFLFATDLNADRWVEYSAANAAAAAAIAATNLAAAQAAAASAIGVSQAFVGVTRATMAALNTSLVQLAYLKDEADEGAFVFDSTSHWDGRRTPVAFDANTTIAAEDAEHGRFLITKTAGADGWNAATYDATALTGDFEIWFQRVNFVEGWFVGFDSSVASTSTYTDLNFAILFGTGTGAAYENGVKSADIAWASALNWYCLRRVGSTITVHENTTRSLTGATLKYTFGTAAAGNQYFKSTTYKLNDSFRLVIQDTANTGTGYVQADVQQAVYIAPNTDTTGASGAWKRVLVGDRVHIEWFGAVGDGSTNDTAAFQAAAEYIEAVDGGTLCLGAGKTYVVGVQTLGGDPANYSYAPDEIFYITGFTGHIKIEGNGATIKAAAGLRIGSFNPATGAVYNPPGGGFSDTTYMASPYEGMIHAESYTGSLEIENLTLHGNEQNLTQGGYWGDVGFQIPCSGLQILPGSGRLICRNVVCTRQGTDGATYQATVDARMDESVIAHFIGCEFTYAGRNGFSLTGGRGVTFENCKFNHTSKGTIQSNPQYGFDMEPDGGQYARDITFINCEFLNNNNGGYGGGSGRMQEINFYDCRFSGDPQLGASSSSIAVFVTKPGHRFHNCRIAGFYQITATDAVKYEFRETIYEEGWGPQFFNCIFTNNPNEYYGGIAPTFSGGGPSVSGPVLFDNCTFDYDVTAWAGTTAYIVNATVRNGSNFYRCTTAGTSAGAGGPSGTGTAITDGTVTWTYAGDIVSALSSDAGSEPYRVVYRNCSIFDYSTGVTNLGGNFEGTTRIKYTAGTPGPHLAPQNIKGRYVYNDVEQFIGSKTFDWPSIAAAGVSTTTVTVPLAKVGDQRNYTAAMSNGWGGLIAFCEVTADNTVTVTAFNPTAGAIDRASGTLSVVGAR